VGWLPSTTPPEQALSAIVSTGVIRQSRIRESMISSAGSTNRVALSASATGTRDPVSGGAVA
jgi:hypothetical protein